MYRPVAQVMQSPGFKIGMNETALGTGVPYWIKVKIASFERFLVRILWKDLMVRTVGQRQAELAFQLSILFDPQSALKVIFKYWLFEILRHFVCTYLGEDCFKNSSLADWSCWRGGWDKRKGEAHYHHFVRKLTKMQRCFRNKIAGKKRSNQVLESATNMATKLAAIPSEVSHIICLL